jgi:small subunit ribosomal protein S20
MAHTKQSKKRIRQNERQKIRNKSRMSRVKTAVRSLEQGIAGGDKEAADKLYRTAASELDRAAKHNLVHRNAAARKKSRLAKRLAKSKA